MSLDIIRSVFENLSSGTNWSLQLLNIKTSKRAGTGYSSRQISLMPSERLGVLINDIVAVYTGNGKKAINTYQAVREYDGTTDARRIYCHYLHLILHYGPKWYYFLFSFWFLHFYLYVTAISRLIYCLSCFVIDFTLANFRMAMKYQSAK